ncbi:lipoyl(octanoyl) transferase LipB [Halobacteriovorax sp. HLS]|uniref:lipoyl(octanoyl) transferase LipB n=1 Tax=Halobacteriovorax sp. HLS TaxID=2234000 RepID=UPI000FD746B3|nr:lipoyl(octanoyl) transferase LipB [Halobacteriovorax sp. HLS]
MEVINLGLIDYKEALDIQLNYLEEVLIGTRDEVLLICHHPSVVTLGKKSSMSDLTGWKGKTYEISRGGKATYHGPGQVVIYPILNLEKRMNDIYAYLRNLELAMVKTLEEFGVKEAKGDPDNTGVWIRDHKIASIGIAIKRWITYHGLAINIFYDKDAFKGINPCGLNVKVMTSLEEILGHKVERFTFEKQLSSNLLELLKI